MEEAGILDRQISELSLTERKELLRKLESHSLVLKAPLYQNMDVSKFAGDVKQRFSKLPKFLRICYHIAGFFNSQSSLGIFKKRELSKLGKRMEAETAAFYNAAQGYLLPQFYEAVAGLKANSYFFYSALETGFNGDKGAFYGFLGSLEMEDIHSRLISETDPRVIADRYPGLSESTLRRIAQKAFDDAMMSITEEQRSRMYANARSLVCLGQLSFFQYDRFIMAFTHNADFGGMVCKAVAVKDFLINLNNILFSLKECPSINLLKSLFIFILQEQKAVVSDDAVVSVNIQQETQKFLAQVETSLAGISDFNRKIPLNLIARIATGDVFLIPKAIPGGEDWFSLYKDHWRRHIDAAFFTYLENRRRWQLQELLADFWGDIKLKPLENAESETIPDGFPVSRANSLKFLLTFHSSVFMPDLYPFLWTVLIDGEFYMRDNQLEFAESYNALINLDEIIRQFDDNLSPQGNWGMRYIQAKNETSILTVKRPKLQIIQEEINGQANVIVDRSIQAMNCMVKLLNGIIEKNPRNKYETLSNLSQLTGKNAKFTGGLRKAALKFEKAVKILKAIALIDSGKR